MKRGERKEIEKVWKLKRKNERTREGINIHLSSLYFFPDSAFPFPSFYTFLPSPAPTYRYIYFLPGISFSLSSLLCAQIQLSLCRRFSLERKADGWKEELPENVCVWWERGNGGVEGEKRGLKTKAAEKAGDGEG